MRDSALSQLLVDNGIRTSRAYILADRGIAEVFSDLPLESFLRDLEQAIETTYLDRQLKTITRIGWTCAGDTFEIMGAQTHDYTCVKIISSNPSLAGSAVPVVAGTLICADRDPQHLDQAALVCGGSAVTALRTAASTAAVMHRVKPNPQMLGVIGAGHEGFTHALVLALMTPSIERIVFTDVDQPRAEQAVSELKRMLHSEGAAQADTLVVSCVEKVDEIREADAIVTATYGQEVVLDAARLRPGTFIAAVGADLEKKRELSDDLYDEARFVADDLIQCFSQGELQHAALRLNVSAAEIAALEEPDAEWIAGDNDLAAVDGYDGAVLGGRMIGAADLLRDSSSFLARSEPIVIYDSTGFSGQDLALARTLLPILQATREPEPWNSGTWEPMPVLLGKA